MATGVFENDTSGNCLQQPATVPDSPDSIPLPDSPPPEGEEERGDRGEANEEPLPLLHNNNNEENVSSVTDYNPSNSSNTNRNRKSNRKPRLAEEYDPSEPLTSSDEEEHSLQLIEGRSSSSGSRNTHNETNRSSTNSVLESNKLTSPKSIRLSTTPPPLSTSKSTSPVKPSSPKYSQEQRSATTTHSGSANNSSNSVSSKLDLNSIPVPPEENRRPVIHFSIPTRHRLLPISSLIKRQKGGARKDGRGDGSIGQQSDAAKAFGLDKSQEDEDDEDDEMDDGRPKISLVAEIFGSDDDNEDETEQSQASESQSRSVDQDQEEPESMQNHFAVAESDDKQPIIDPNSGRWKLVSDEAILNNAETVERVTSVNPESGIISQMHTPPPELDTEETEEIAEDEPEIIEIVTINIPPANRLRTSLRRRPFLSGRLGFDNGGEPEVIDIDKDDDEPEPEPEPIVVVPPAPPAAPPSPSPPPRRVTPEPDVSRDIERERERPASSPERERHFKRPHSSSSMSNCEEGEIVDQNPSKKRKKDKRKKTKKRKRSKDSATPPPKPSEKRLSDHSPPPVSDHEDNGSGNRSAVSWRKPSKRTQNRNYRDGKPKADDTFFREKEVDDKQRSNSPSHRRSRAATRKDKSPIKEKSGGKHRRDGSPKIRSHSKSPGRGSRSRSRSSGRLYRSRRRNRRSRSKSSNSLSDKSRSGRSSSRRRRRYRRSNSRHRAGDSRSPSYITEPIRSRSSNYAKLRDRSRSRSRDRHFRGRHRKPSSHSKSLSPSARAHKRNKKPESLDRQQRRKQVKEKEKPETVQPDLKEKKREKEKLKEKERRKKKEVKPKEEEKSKVREKSKEKEKKKKRKRREKSPTPVKAIVADGDSIVVSLSFQKGKTTSFSNVQSCASSEDRNENGLDASENTDPISKQVPKVNNNEVEEGGDFSEEPERSQSSPAKLSSVTDDEDTLPPTDPNPTTERSKSKNTIQIQPNEDKETEAVKVTSSGGGSCGSSSPFETERSFSAAADSTKIVTPQQSEQQEATLSQSRRSSMSPTDVEFNAQGDSLVTSTGDSMEANATADDESSKSNSSATPSKTQDNKHLPTLSHKITTTNVSPRFQMTQNSTADNAASVATSATTAPISQSSVAPTMTRPLIGNIPGLYPSSAIITTGGAAPVPPPIVIPTPPPPQGIRFSGGSTPMLNPNVLASVASALLAVRQNPPSYSHGKLPAVGGMNNSDSTPLRHMSVLGPRTQNFSNQANSRNSTGNSFSQQQEGGDSPMSPNSSDGDDLFEPPTDRPQSEGGLNAPNGGGKPGKNGQALGIATMGNANDSFNSAGNASNKPRERSTLFDNLFGGPDPKKAVANKPEKMSKSKAKQRKAGPKKETIKVSTSVGLTEGELRLTDEVPTSAVELIVKQKFLKKLNRQERVVEEVKLSLKPYYSKRQINKDEYKDILRRAVPKICHNKTGEINPGKIKELVEAYVKKFRHARKRGDVSNAK